MRKILFLGDSNTYGFDPDHGRYPSSIRWLDTANRILSAKAIILVNAGMNGREIPVSEEEINSALLKCHEDACDTMAVMLGSNDLLNMMKPDAQEAGERMKAFLQRVPEKIGLILAVPPRMKVSDEGGFCPDERTVRAVEELVPVYRKLAEQFHTQLINTQNWPLDLSYDGVHLSQAGHQSFAFNMIQSLI